jgi:hypothetical protein
VSLPIRRRTAGKRSRRVRRTSPLISRTRLLAAIGVALVTVAFYLFSVESVFAVDPLNVTIVGATYADRDAIRQDLQLPSGGGDTLADRNVFRLTTAEMERRIESLPSVLSANVETSLPNRLIVRIHERQPILLWQTSQQAWLVDLGGFVIAPAVPQQQPDSAALLVIHDQRTQPETLAPGTRLAPLDIEVARLLGGLTPGEVGSSATAFTVSLDDQNGWTVAAVGGWQAIFGHFTSELHTTDDIPLQVQCLASLLTDREQSIATVVLAVATDRCGTYTESGASAKPGGKQNALPSPTVETTARPQDTRPPKAGANPSTTPTQKVKPNRTPKAEPNRTPRPSR